MKKLLRIMALLTIHIGTVLVATEEPCKMYFFLNQYGSLRIVHDTEDNFRFDWDKKFIEQNHASILLDPFDLESPNPEEKNCRLFFLSSSTNTPIENKLSTGYTKLRKLPDDLSFNENPADEEMLRFLESKSYSKKYNNFIMIKNRLKEYLREKCTRLIGEYADNMQYPLTRKKVKKLREITQKKEVLYLLSGVKKYHQHSARTAYPKKLRNMLNDTLDRENGLILLNKQYQKELSGIFTDNKIPETAITIRTLRAIRKFLLNILLGNHDTKINLKADSLSHGWFWFRPTQQIDDRRFTSQNLIKLLAENNWDESLIAKNELYTLLKEIPKHWSWKKFLPHFYKIHIMPKPAYVPDTVNILLELFDKEKMGSYVKNFKLKQEFASAHRESCTPTIVLYIYPPSSEKDYTSNVQHAIDLLLTHTKEKWGSGLVPRFSKKINRLIFYAQGDGFSKKRHPKNLEVVFEGPEFACYNPEWVGDPNADFTVK